MSKEITVKEAAKWAFFAYKEDPIRYARMLWKGEEVATVQQLILCKLPNKERLEFLLTEKRVAEVFDPSDLQTPYTIDELSVHDWCTGDGRVLPAMFSERLLLRFTADCLERYLVAAAKQYAVDNHICDMPTWIRDLANGLVTYEQLSEAFDIYAAKWRVRSTKAFEVSRGAISVAWMLRKPASAARYAAGLAIEDLTGAAEEAELAWQVCRVDELYREEEKGL